MNSIGQLFRLTTFGESHGPSIGGIIDGCPSNMVIDMQLIEAELKRRATANAKFSSQRNEPDKVRFLSGIFDGKTLGTPIAFVVENKDANGKHYEALKHIYRPSHADYTYQVKYGIRDARGGGRASARTTLPIVVAGAIAKQILQKENIVVQAYTKQIGDIKLDSPTCFIDSNAITDSTVFCPDKECDSKMLKTIESAQAEGDSLGGVVACCIHNMPEGIGEPIFDKMQARLAYAIFSIPSVKAFEYGGGFAMTAMKGSECNDAFVVNDKKITTSTNFSGGIQGGITNGADITFNVGFKPIPSICKPQSTVTDKGEETSFSIEGRYDVCAVPRACVIVEALAAIVVADMLMLNRR